VAVVVVVFAQDGIPAVQILQRFVPVPVLWIPLAQCFEEAVAATNSQHAQEAVWGLSPELSLDVLTATARSLESAVLVISETWDRRHPTAVVPPSSQRHVEYDSYFNVRRRNDVEPLVALGEAAVVAYYRMVMNLKQGSSLRPPQIAALRNAFALIFALTPADLPAGSTSAIEIPAAADGRSGQSIAQPLGQPIDAMLRWQLGHHVFFVLLQALITVHLRLAATLNRQQWAETEAVLAQATRLWDGTVVAFQYAGDFAAEDYEEIVRPSMSPPLQQEGFSGFFSSDHVTLIHVLKGLRPALQRLPSELGDAHQAYLRAVDTAYEAHAFVCEVFVGAGSSLRGGHLNRSVGGPSFIRHTLKPRTLAAAGYSDERKRGAAWTR
jgi:hypothetical protein